MFWAACSLGYFGFLRASEFTVPNLSTFSASLHLSVHDIAVNSSVALLSMRIRIKGFKTDPFRKGCFLHIGLGRHPLCAVQAMMSYLASRGDAPGLLFLFTTGQPLTRTSLTDWLRQILASAWILGNFSSHSFRIGAASVAACNGVLDHLIQTMGRWSSNANQLYIRTPADSLAAPFSKISLGTFRGFRQSSIQPILACRSARYVICLRSLLYCGSFFWCLGNLSFFWLIGGTRSPCRRVPPFSKHLENRLFGWSRFQGCLYTSSLLLAFGPPLTFKAPAPKLIFSDEFKCG